MNTSRSDQPFTRESRTRPPAAVTGPAGVPRHHGVINPRYQTIPANSDQLSKLMHYRCNLAIASQHNNIRQSTPTSLINHVPVDKTAQIAFGPFTVSPGTRNSAIPRQLQANREAGCSEVTRNPVITSYNCPLQIVNPPAAAVAKEHKTTSVRLSQTPVVPGYEMPHNRPVVKPPPATLLMSTQNKTRGAEQYKYAASHTSETTNIKECKTPLYVNRHDRKIQINNSTAIPQSLLPPNMLHAQCHSRHDCSTSTAQAVATGGIHLHQLDKPETTTAGAFKGYVYIQPKESVKPRVNCSTRKVHFVEGIKQKPIHSPKKIYYLRSPTQVKNALCSNTDNQVDHTSSEVTKKKNPHINQTVHVLPLAGQHGDNNLHADLKNNKQSSARPYTCTENERSQKRMSGPLNVIHHQAIKRDVACNNENEIIEITDDEIDEEDTSTTDPVDNCVFDLGKYMNRADVPTINPCIITGSVNLNFNVNGNRQLSLTSDVHASQTGNIEADSGVRKMFSIADGKVYLQDQIISKDKPHCEKLSTYRCDKSSEYHVQTEGKCPVNDDQRHNHNNQLRYAVTHAELFSKDKRDDVCRADDSNCHCGDNNLGSPVRFPLNENSRGAVVIDESNVAIDECKQIYPNYKDIDKQTKVPVSSSTIMTTLARRHLADTQVQKLKHEQVDIIRKQLNDAIDKTQHMYLKHQRMTTEATHSTQNASSFDLEKETKTFSRASNNAIRSSLETQSIGDEINSTDIMLKKKKATLKERRVSSDNTSPLGETAAICTPSTPMDVNILRQSYFNSPQQSDGLQVVIESKLPKTTNSQHQSSRYNRDALNYDTNTRKPIATKPCTVQIKKLPNVYFGTSNSNHNGKNIVIPTIVRGESGTPSTDHSITKTSNIAQDQNTKGLDYHQPMDEKKELLTNKSNSDKMTSLEQLHNYGSTSTINTENTVHNLGHMDSPFNDKMLLQEVLNDIHQIEAVKADNTVNVENIDRRISQHDVKRSVQSHTSSSVKSDIMEYKKECVDKAQIEQNCEDALFAIPLNGATDASAPVVDMVSQYGLGGYSCIICALNFPTNHALRAHEHVHVRKDSLHICSETKQDLGAQAKIDTGHFINDEDTDHHEIASGNTVASNSSVKCNSPMSIDEKLTANLTTDLGILEIDEQIYETEKSPTEDYYNLMADDNDRDMVPVQSGSNSSCAETVNSVLKRRAQFEHVETKEIKTNKRKRKKHTVSLSNKKRSKHACYKCGRLFKSFFILDCHVNFCRQKGKHVLTQSRTEEPVAQMDNIGICSKDEHDDKSHTENNVEVVVADICSPSSRRYTCNICGSSFAYQVQLMRHSMNHKTCESTALADFGTDQDEHNCRYCSKTFHSMGQLSQHINQHKLECDRCDTKFKKLFSLFRHVNRYHNYSTDCSNKTCDQLEYYELKKHNTHYKCTDNNTSIENKTKPDGNVCDRYDVPTTQHSGLICVDNHQLSKVEPSPRKIVSKHADHNNYIRCKLCGYESTCSSRKEALLHRYHCLYSRSQKCSSNDDDNSHELLSDDADSRIRTCTYCNKYFQSPQYAKLHIQFCTALLSTEKKQSLDDRDVLNDTKKTVTDSVPESKCKEIKQHDCIGKNTYAEQTKKTSTSNTVAHSSLEVDKTGCIDIVKCIICKMTFNSLTLLFQHQCDTNVEEKSLSKTQESELTDRNCNVEKENHCKKENDTARANIRNSKLPLQEQQCKQKTSSVIQTCHIFRCNFCVCGFKKATQLKKHIRRCHRFKCEVCGTEFKRKHDLSCHSSSCHGITTSHETCSNKLYKCQFCGKTVKKINHLKVHLLFCKGNTMRKNTGNGHTENMVASETLDTASDVDATCSDLAEYSPRDSVEAMDLGDTCNDTECLTTEGDLEDDQTRADWHLHSSHHTEMSTGSYTHEPDSQKHENSHSSKVPPGSYTCEPVSHIQDSQQSPGTLCEQESQKLADSQQSEASSGSYTCDNVKNTGIVFECQECSAMFIERPRLHKHMLKWHVDKLAHYYGDNQ